MIIKEYIMNTIDYLETKKITDIDFETKVLTFPTEEDKNKPLLEGNFLITKYKNMMPTSNQGQSAPTAVWVDTDTFEPKVEIHLATIKNLDSTLSFMVTGTSDGSIEVVEVKCNNANIPLEFLRSDETDPSIVSLTTMRELGKETKAESFSL
mgnify:CR=1 FL=1